MPSMVPSSAQATALSPRRNLFDCLMVHGVDPCASSRTRPPAASPAATVSCLGKGGPIAGLTVIVQVLDQRAAQRHVEQLLAAANAEGRNIRVERPACDGELQAIQLSTTSVLGWRASPYSSGSTSAPPGKTMPSSRSSRACRASGPSGGISTGSPPAHSIACGIGGARL